MQTKDYIIRKLSAKTDSGKLAPICICAVRLALVHDGNFFISAVRHIITYYPLLFHYNLTNVAQMFTILICDSSIKYAFNGQTGII